MSEEKKMATAEVLSMPTTATLVSPQSCMIAAEDLATTVGTAPACDALGALLAAVIFKSHADHAFVEYVSARPGEGAVGASVASSEESWPLLAFPARLSRLRHGSGPWALRSPRKTPRAPRQLGGIHTVAIFSSASAMMVELNRF
jgi:hypothetical protein